MKKFMILGLTILLTAMVSSNAYAHYCWINVDNYSPKVDEEVVISIGYGHCFPMDGVFKKAEDIESFYLVDPEGKILALEVKTQGEGEEKQVSPIKIRLKRSGTYLIVFEKKSKFLTKTTEGYKYQSKKGLKGVIKSYWSEGSAKAIINVGQTSGNSFQKEINKRYQVIPLDDPGKLKEGDYFRAKITLDGKPYSTKVFATYAGFSTEKETFAYTTGTDKDGIAKIKILKSGVWLIKAHDEIPYSNPEEADVFSFTSALTFEIK